MRLRDVDGVASIIAASSLAQDPIWEKDLAKLSEADITLFYARAGLQSRRVAIGLMERVQSAAIVSAFHGNKEAGLSAIISHTPPVDPFMVDELVEGLAKLAVPRRRAVIYALTMAVTPPIASALIWDAVPPKEQMPPLAQEVIAESRKTRHIRLPYVFWEWATPRIAAPLMHLEQSAVEAFDCTWPQLAEKHSRMIRLNRGADAASFLQLADEVRRGQL